MMQQCATMIAHLPMSFSSHLSTEVFTDILTLWNSLVSDHISIRKLQHMVRRPYLPSPKG